MSFAARVNAALFAVTGKSFAAFAASWSRGDDMADNVQPNRLSEPYSQSSWIRAAQRAISGEISGRALKFYDGENEVTDPAFVAWWEAPALGPKTLGAAQPRLTRADVLRDLASWASGEGEFFLLFDDAWLLATASRNPASLTPFIIANPSRMQVIVQGDTLVGWRYSEPGGRQIILLPEQVVHWKDYNAYDDWRGVGALAAARIASESAFSTGVYIRDLMRNNGDQGMNVIAKNGVVDDAQRDQIKADLRAKRASLRRGIAVDSFFTGDITIERPPERSASTDLLGTLSLSAQEIFIAFGVPPSMATVKQSYSVGKDSDRYQLITATCMPTGNAIASTLAKVGSRMAGRTLTAELDWDDHPVMVEVRNGRIDSLLKLWGVGVPVSVANDYLDLGLDPFPGWDVGYLPFSVSATGDATPAVDPSKDPTLAEPKNVTPDLPEIAQIKALIATRSRMSCEKVGRTVPDEPSDEFAMFRCQCPAHLAFKTSLQPAENKAQTPKQIAQWKTLMSKRRATVKSFQSAIGRVVMGARQEVLRKLDSMAGAGLERSATTKAAAVDFLFDLAKFTDAFTATMRKQQKSALQTAGEQLLGEVGKDDPFTYPAAEVLDFLAGRENKLRDVPTSIYEEIKATLEEGLNKGDTADELAARVRGAFNGISDERAKSIALTETGAAYGAGRDQAMKQAGVQYKAWLTSGNDNVRAAHLQAGADYPPERAIPIDEPFVVDGESLMYPGEEGGSAANVINCHCVSISVAAPKSSDS